MLTIGLNDNQQKADVIFILGNKVETNGQPSERLKSRLEKGLQLYQQKLAPIIIVSGGIGIEGYDEAKVMKNYLTAQGVPKEAIIEDNQGNNTYLSAKNLKEVSQSKNLKSIIIVSQYYHLLRAELAVQKAGFTTTYHAHAEMYPELRDLYSIPREFIGYYAYLFGNYND